MLPVQDPKQLNVRPRLSMLAVGPSLPEVGAFELRLELCGHRLFGSGQACKTVLGMF